MSIYFNILSNFIIKGAHKNVAAFLYYIHKIFDILNLFYIMQILPQIAPLKVFLLHVGNNYAACFVVT